MEVTAALLFCPPRPFRHNCFLSPQVEGQVLIPALVLQLFAEFPLGQRVAASEEVISWHLNLPAQLRPMSELGTVYVTYYINVILPKACIIP